MLRYNWKKSLVPTWISKKCK